MRHHMPDIEKGLRAWRQAYQLTLQELADLSGISVAMLSRVERGERRLKPEIKVLIARRLGVRVRDLFPIQEVRTKEEVLPPESRR